jgi:hypothetical protein
MKINARTIADKFTRLYSWLSSSCAMNGQEESLTGFSAFRSGPRLFDAEAFADVITACHFGRRHVVIA